MFRILKLGLPATRQLSLGLLLTFLQGFSSVALMATSAWLISRAAEQPPVMFLMLGVVGVRAFALGRAGFRYAERLITHEAAFAQLSKLRPKLFNSLIPFAPAALEKAGVGERGEFLSKSVIDIDELQNLPLRVVGPLFQSIIITILTVIGVSWFSQDVASILLVASLFVYLIVFPLAARISSFNEKKYVELRPRLQARSIFIVQNFELLQAYGWLGDQLNTLKSTDNKLKANYLKSAWSTGLSSGLITLVMYAALAMSVLVSGNQINSQLMPGVMLAVVALVVLAMFEIQQAAVPATIAFLRYAESAKRVMSIFDAEAPCEVVVDRGASRPGELRDVSIKGLMIKYPDRDALNCEFNFDMELGQSLAISGPSGSGKTSLAYVLLGFLRPFKGEVLLNNTSLNEVSAEWLNSQVGLIEQNPTIFRGTVRQNLLLANPDSLDSDLEKVLRDVRLWAMLKEREGLDTQVGDRGLLLSGGEAQRLALARAMLSNFKLLILDEPTANVDQESASVLVQDLLSAANLQGKRMVILITHDPDIAALVQRQIEVS